MMTTNQLEYLDETLVCPGRIDQRIELRLADREIFAKLFRIVYEPLLNATEIHSKKSTLSNDLIAQFLNRVPDLEFSPAEVISFLLQIGSHRQWQVRMWKVGLQKLENIKSKESMSLGYKHEIPPLEIGSIDKVLVSCYHNLEGAVKVFCLSRHYSRTTHAHSFLNPSLQGIGYL